MSQDKHKTSIGGQAVMEGVMMRGPYKTAIAVRKSDGEIVTKIDDIGTKKRNKIIAITVVITLLSTSIVSVLSMIVSAF